MNQPWPPGVATDKIRNLAARDMCDLAFTRHAKERMLERGLIIGDVFYLLRHGYVYEDPEKTSDLNLWKYRMEASTPNSEGRTVRIVVIPDARKRGALKVVTVMWVDE